MKDKLAQIEELIKSISPSEGRYKRLSNAVESQDPTFCFEQGEFQGEANLADKVRAILQS